MNDPGDFRPLLEEFRHALRVLAVLGDAQRQRLQSLQRQERVERRHRRAEIAQQGDARLDDVGDRTERLHRLGPYRAMIARVRRIERRLAQRMRGPIERAAVDEQAADRIAVAADIFGRGMNHDRRAVLERLGQDRRRRVVHNKRDAEIAADLGHLGDREHRKLRVRQRLGVISAGAIVGGTPEIVRIDRVDEADFDALILHRVGEEIPRPAIEIGRADDIVAGTRDVLDRENRSRLPGRQRQSGDAAFQRRYALFQHVVRRVHDAGIDVAELLEREQVRCMLGVVELIRRCLIDRHGNGAGRGVRAPAGVQSNRFRMF